MSITRRIFLRNGSLAVIGTAAIPAFLTRAASAAESLGAKNKRLVVIFQRGAADGLNIVVPHAERAYYAMRPSINIPRNAVIELDGFFGLHPALAPFQPLWKQHHLAIVHAAGSPDPPRSHFDAQDFMESGTHQSHRRWLAEPRITFRFARPVCVSRHRPGAIHAANSLRQPACSRHKQHQRFRRRRKQSESLAQRDQL